LVYVIGQSSHPHLCTAETGWQKVLHEARGLADFNIGIMPSLLLVAIGLVYFDAWGWCMVAPNKTMYIILFFFLKSWETQNFITIKTSVYIILEHFSLKQMHNPVSDSRL
jgi:hypothetical protein